jgi:S1-C subfamily serine protease
VQYDRFSFDLTEIPAGAGSGFIWDDKGHIVTNAHVIATASAAKVTLNDGTTLPARLTGAAADFDLAVLKIDPPLGKRLPAIPLGRSSDLQVGQKVFAIGNPFGLDQSLTTGVISALGRQIKSLTRQRIEDVIQTDAAINPGNSGGPLLDSAGRLIGVNTQIVSPSGAYAGIGFAIPVDTVNVVVPELIRHGKLSRPTIGVVLQDELQARRWGVKSGALIRNVVPGGPAEQAGLRSLRPIAGNRLLGDVIVSVDGKKVMNPDDFTSYLAKKKVGDSVQLVVNRNGEEIEFTVPLVGG